MDVGRFTYLRSTRCQWKKTEQVENQRYAAILDRMKRWSLAPCKTERVERPAGLRYGSSVCIDRDHQNFWIAKRWSYERGESSVEMGGMVQRWADQRTSTEQGGLSRVLAYYRPGGSFPDELLCEHLPDRVGSCEMNASAAQHPAEIHALDESATVIQKELDTPFVAMRLCCPGVARSR
ncbi:hypothetical protein BDM02DRAFT_3259708 [Thelephora ganbajun]|uniref:Uncharacterized protein n=1 Tax=Thelephora ganbajun TaxID=370292 RepID=A0ACB6ZM82_THEGA|nr:hypothetical protein BDM02DRAFT_3259708 [Thelephora ganbajun]